MTVTLSFCCITLIVLCYLTCGVVGVLLFLFERRSRFAKQNAVQAMLIGILSAITVLMASMMHRIFSYMFPPVQNVTLMIKYSTILFCALLLLSGLVLALLGRKFSLPIVGNLSIKSSHCDTLDTYDDEKK